MYLHQETQISKRGMQHIASMWCGNTAMLEQGIERLSHHVVYVEYKIPTYQQQISALAS